MQRLDDAEFGRRQRERNLRANRQRRERLMSAGYCQWTLWIAGDVRQQAEQLAAQRHQTPAELISALLTAALSEPAKPAHLSPVSVDTLPLFDTAAALRPGGTDSGSVDDRLARIQALKREQPTLSNYAIAAQVGCSEPTVRRALKRLQAETTV